MHNPRWRKVLRDLWDNKTRTMLVVLAIAVGIFAFGSVFITQKVLLADLGAQYRSINASTITMGIPSFEDSLVRWVRHQEQVVDAQGRAIQRVRLLRENGAYNVDLYAFDDYENMQVNRISMEKGTCSD
jgi:putative ABC transport system permease protein